MVYLQNVGEMPTQLFVGSLFPVVKTLRNKPCIDELEPTTW